MENLQSIKDKNYSTSLERKFLINRKKLNFIWLLTSHPTKTFSIDEIVDSILNSGIMIHERKFMNMIVQNRCRKTGVPFPKKKSKENFEHKNKYLNNDFNYL